VVVEHHSFRSQRAECPVDGRYAQTADT